MHLSNCLYEKFHSYKIHLVKDLHVMGFFLLFFVFHFCLLAAPLAYGNSQAMEQIHTMVMTMLDP